MSVYTHAPPAMPADALEMLHIAASSKFSSSYRAALIVGTVTEEL